MKIFASLFILLGIAFVVSVIAAGTSEGGDLNNTNITINNTNNNATVNNTRDDDREENETDDDENKTRGGNRSRYEYEKRNCETFNSTNERLRCRIIQGENYTAPSGNIPEACRLNNTEIKGRCVAFYATIQTCYKLPAKAKDACFRRASGLTKKFDEEFQEGRREKARNYMVTLLYELEQRVERAHEKEKISDDNAVLLVDKIVQIKKVILEGKSKDEIKTMLRDLRETWKASKIKIDETNTGGENE